MDIATLQHEAGHAAVALWIGCTNVVLRMHGSTGQLDFTSPEPKGAHALWSLIQNGAAASTDLRAVATGDLINGGIFASAGFLAECESVDDFLGRLYGNKDSSSDGTKFRAIADELNSRRLHTPPLARLLWQTCHKATCLAAQPIIDSVMLQAKQTFQFDPCHLSEIHRGALAVSVEAAMRQLQPVAQHQ